MHQFLPWQTGITDQLLQRWRAGELPHALLFSGAEGIGKNHFAGHFSRLLFCKSGSTTDTVEPCGHCQGCKLMNAGTHPDFRWVQSDEGKAIPIDTIRGIGEFLSLKSQLSSMQVVIISPADKLNIFAANSLLKTLEEPTANTLLILVTSRPDRLLPTIRSRCQIVPFPVPPRDKAAAWMAQQCQANRIATGSSQDSTEGKDTTSRLLALAGGAPLVALKYAQTGALAAHDDMLGSFEKLAAQGLDPVSEAGKWFEKGSSQSIKWLISWTTEMIRLKSAADLADNSDGDTANRHSARLKKLSEKTDLKRLFAYLDKLTECLRLLDTQVNQQLIMEDLLIGWSRLGKLP